jgi:hypothetical protein
LNEWRLVVLAGESGQELDDDFEADDGNLEPPSALAVWPASEVAVRPAAMQARVPAGQPGVPRLIEVPIGDDAQVRGGGGGAATPPSQPSRTQSLFFK